jgi:hypothetical protein
MSLTFNEDAVFVKVKRALQAKGGLKAAVRAFRAAQDAKAEMTAQAFAQTLAHLGAPVSAGDLTFLCLAFRKVAKDDASPIDVNVVVRELCGGLNKRRLNAVEQAYAALSAGGPVTAAQMLQTCNASAFAATVRTVTEGQEAGRLQQAFGGDEIVTHEEFLAYYCGVSATIPLDHTFEVAVLRSWAADNSQAPRLGETQRSWPAGDSLEVKHAALVKEALSPTFLAIEKIKAYDYTHAQRVAVPPPYLPIVVPDYVTTTTRDFPPYSPADMRKSDPLLARTIGRTGY